MSSGRVEVEPGDQPSFYVPGVARYFKTTMLRRADGVFQGASPLRPDLVDASGGLRLGALTYVVDVATGICSGVAVVDRGLWIVTTDIQLELVEPITVGPARVEARTVRAGATTVVCEFVVHDEGRADHVVGGGTTTNRPFPFEGDFSMLQFPVGLALRHDDGSPVTDEPMFDQLGGRALAGGVAEIDVTERLRNPWGILHGGVTGMLVEAAAVAAVRDELVPCGVTVRYLAPGRVGPVRAEPRVVAAGPAGALVQVEVRDRGQDDRLMAIATVTLR